MLPKSARLFLFAAVLASANAHGAPSVRAGAGRAAQSCPGGRELAFFALAGAQLFSGDVTIVVSLLEAQQDAQRKAASGGGETEPCSTPGNAVETGDHQ